MVAVNEFGMITTKLGTEFKTITVRAERTRTDKGEFTSISLADDAKEIMIQVPYDAIKECLRRL